MDGEAGGATARLDGRARYCRVGSPAMNETSAPGGRRTRVALVFGGRSGEHAISCATAAGVLRALDPERYEVLPIGITPDGQWVLTAADPDALAWAVRSCLVCPRRAATSSCRWPRTAVTSR